MPERGWVVGQISMNAPRLWLDWVGTKPNRLGSGWSLSSVTVGYRIGGTWHDTSIAQGTLLELGLADAYRVQAVIAAAPATSGNYCDWYADWGTVDGGDGPLARDSGVDFQTDNSSCTLYLFRRAAVVLSNSTGTLPVVGDTVEVVTDFSAQTATAYINGVSVASFSFAGQSWYTADGQNA